MKRENLIVIIICFLFIACQKKSPALFTELSAEQTHIDFQNKLTNTPELNILTYLYYYNGAGVAAADFNNDGLVDLFFTGNQVQDELYLNLGQMKFKKVTEQAGIAVSNSWSTGVSHVDINNDGLLDLYICKASGYRSLQGKNLLYINQGVNADGIPIFKEQAEAYGLDFSGLSTKASFFDYDLDGDLDMYLMNHSVHPNRTYGRGSQRKQRDSISGDILYQNQQGRYVDVSQNAGIFQGKSGYGLGLSIGDVNNDQYPDIYVGNDFFENDYLYINKKDGTFEEVISKDNEKLGHTTHFSMGNTIADMNNDGLLDIISLDMLPEDMETYKTSGLEYAFPIYQQYLRNGYAPQYMQNTFLLNLDGTHFSEIGSLSGISSTEWSWSALAADFDSDGYKDIFISNGIKGATNDMDYMNFIANEDIQRRIDAGMKKTDLPLVQEIPEKKVPNYFFKNNGDLSFENVTETWFKSKPSFSNGCVYADLDNDGDLDIIVNNVNEVASILKNQSNGNNYIKFAFEGPSQNTSSIGVKAVAFTGTRIFQSENFPHQSYLSSLPPNIHLGLGKVAELDSVKIIWPDGKLQTLTEVSTDTLLKVSYKNATFKTPNKANRTQLWAVNDTLVDFTHEEQFSLDFDREPLIPYASSNEGPSISVGDLNGDGLEDVFVGGAKGQSNSIFHQTPQGEFQKDEATDFSPSKTNEVTASILFDADGDGIKDLLVASGGNEFTIGKPLQPILYINRNGVLKPKQNAFKSIETNASMIKTVDFDQDGDLDIYIVSDRVPGAFGKTPKQYLLINDGRGNFEDQTKKLAPQLEYFGNIKAIECVDINADGRQDLVVVGHWIPISIFIHDGSQLRLQENNGLKDTNGWWNSVHVNDFDKDGDLDLVCGNWGLNTKFKASLQQPITLYRNDFDGNGSVEPLVTYYYQGIETPFASKDELTKQIPQLNKEFLSYKKFAQASLQDLFGNEQLKDADQKYVYELETAYFENNGQGVFKKHSIPVIAQASQTNDIMVDDFNKDGYADLLIIGNNYHISTQLGRQDAFHGLILENNTKGGFIWNANHSVGLNGVSRTIKKINTKSQTRYLIGRNNQRLTVLQQKQDQK